MYLPSCSSFLLRKFGIWNWVLGHLIKILTEFEHAELHLHSTIVVLVARFGNTPNSLGKIAIKILSSTPGRATKKTIVRWRCNSDFVLLHYIVELWLFRRKTLLCILYNEGRKNIVALQAGDLVGTTLNFSVFRTMFLQLLRGI